MSEKKLSDVSDELKKPFPESEISVRVGGTFKSARGVSGIALPYIDARQVMERFDTIVGPENWSDDYQIVDNHAVLCRLTVLGVTKADAGQSKADGDKGEAKDLKAAVSDAFKRAAVKFGIGQFLYSLPRQYEDLDDKKRFKRKPEAIVHDILRKANLPADKVQSAPKAEVKTEAKAPVSEPASAPAAVTEDKNDLCTPEQVSKMQELKAKLKVSDNTMLNPYIKDWSKGKHESFRVLNRGNIDDFMVYVQEKTKIKSDA